MPELPSVWLKFCSWMRRLLSECSKHVVRFYMTVEQQKLVHPAEQAEQIIITPRHDLSDKRCHLACLGTSVLSQSRLKGSDANCVLVPLALSCYTCNSGTAATLF